MLPFASELYPTLGPLLTHLCRNPVVLSSIPMASLVAHSVFKYSNQDSDKQQQQQQQQGLGPHQRNFGTKDQGPKLSAERAWCAARLRDMIETSRHRERRRSDTSAQSITRDEKDRVNSRHGKGSSGTLLQVSDHDMRQQRIEQTIANLVKSLSSLQEMVVQDQPLRAVDSMHLVKMLDNCVF